MIRLRVDGLVWQQIEGEIVVLDTSASQYLALKGSGAALWHLLSEGTTRADLASALVERYGITADRAARDVDAFLASLEQRRLIDA